MKANYGKKAKNREIKRNIDKLMKEQFEKLIRDKVIKSDYGTEDTFFFSGEYEEVDKTEAGN